MISWYCYDFYFYFLNFYMIGDLMLRIGLILLSFLHLSFFHYNYFLISDYSDRKCKLDVSKKLKIKILYSILGPLLIPASHIVRPFPCPLQPPLLKYILEKYFFYFYCKRNAKNKVNNFFPYTLLIYNILLLTFFIRSL